MAAISSTIMQICNKGDHIVCSDTVYGGTFALLHDYLPLKMGIDVTFVSPEDPNNFEKAITKKTKLIYTEVLSNPTLKVANLPEISKICKKHGILFVVDNTFTPVIVSPVKHGADIVVYSMTKYINGASDIIAGAICASQKFIQSLMDLHTGR
jgi:methionine-gamma-lyase